MAHTFIKTYAAASFPLGRKAHHVHVWTVCPTPPYCRVRRDAGWRTREMTRLPPHHHRNVWLLRTGSDHLASDHVLLKGKEGRLYPREGLGRVWNFTLLAHYQVRSPGWGHREDTQDFWVRDKQLCNSNNIITWGPLPSTSHGGDLEGTGGGCTGRVFAS